MHAQVPKPDVVLTTHDAVTGGEGAGDALIGVQWDLMLLDQRHKTRGSLTKAREALRDVKARYRLLLTSSVQVRSAPSPANSGSYSLQFQGSLASPSEQLVILSSRSSLTAGLLLPGKQAE